MGGFLRISISRDCFWWPLQISTTWLMSLLATSESVSPMLTWIGLVRMAVATRTTARGHVAVKKSVWRWEGARARILRICGSKPMSSMRSASSNTMYDDDPRLTPPDSRKSLRRPGVAIAIWGPLRSSRSWFPLGAPPYRHTESMPMARPNLRHSSWIWVASSRVGERTTTVGPTGRSPLEDLLWMCMMPGNRYPTVLPDPVLATEMMSYPCRAMGHDCAWIGVGFAYPARVMASSRGPGHAPSVKFCMGSGTTMPWGALTEISCLRR
mmetsp:Transcript_7839/g.12349  ORF Transcript_7839/g.12349 Transcript_7839/m.12349 type:complete len:268 (-) Transcript_7839:424-1227(-)